VTNTKEFAAKPKLWQQGYAAGLWDATPTHNTAVSAKLDELIQDRDRLADQLATTRAELGRMRADDLIGEDGRVAGWAFWSVEAERDLLQSELATARATISEYDKLRHAELLAVDDDKQPGTVPAKWVLEAQWQRDQAVQKGLDLAQSLNRYRLAALADRDEARDTLNDALDHLEAVLGSLNVSHNHQTGEYTISALSWRKRHMNAARKFLNAHRSK
jgi:hypothetical protein